MTTAEIAKSYLARGWSIVPLVPRAKRPSRKLEPYLHGEARMTPEECDAHWAANPEDGIAVITGAPSMLIVVDGDRRHGADIDAMRADCPSGYDVQTGNGAHLYCTHPGVSPIPSGKTERPGVDRKGDGGYVVAPPSIHPDTGEPYLCVADGAPILVPDWVLRSPAPTVGDGGAGREPWVADLLAKGAASVEPGTQHEMLRGLAWWASGHMEEDIARSWLIDWARGLPLSRPYQPWTPGDINELLDSALRKRAEKPIAFETQLPSTGRSGSAVDDSSAIESPTINGRLGDLDTALLFKLVHKKNVRYVEKWGRWHMWDSVAWRADGLLRVEHLVHELMLALLHQAVATGDQRHIREVSVVKSDRMIRATLNRARAMCAVEPDIFDRDPWLLTVENGTLDLRTGVLRAPSHDDFITKVAPVAYDPSARSELWERYLHDVTGGYGSDGDPELEAFLARVIGYALTGDTREEKLFFFYGPKQTGKTTLLEAVKAMLGPYATKADKGLVLRRPTKLDASNPRSGTARLKGARFALCEEFDEGERFAEGAVKELTGGNTMTGSELYHDAFEFRPQFKLFLASNAAPKFDADDAAMERRLARIPFNHIVPDEKCDRSLKPRLLDLPVSRAAVLAWAMRGCLEWQRIGLCIPPIVQQDTRRMVEEVDDVRLFLDDVCANDKTAFVTNVALYEAYTAWCKSTRERPSPRVAFFKRLTHLGYVAFRTHGQRGWQGLKLALRFHDPFVTQPPLEGGQQ